MSFISAVAWVASRHSRLAAVCLHPLWCLVRFDWMQRMLDEHAPLPVIVSVPWQVQGPSLDQSISSPAIIELSPKTSVAERTISASLTS